MQVQMKNKDPDEIKIRLRLTNGDILDFFSLNLRFKIRNFKPASCRKLQTKRKKCHL